MRKSSLVSISARALPALPCLFHVKCVLLFTPRVLSLFRPLCFPSFPQDNGFRPIRVHWPTCWFPLVFVSSQRSVSAPKNITLLPFLASRARQPSCWRCDQGYVPPPPCHSKEFFFCLHSANTHEPLIAPVDRACFHLKVPQPGENLTPPARRPHLDPPALHYYFSSVQSCLFTKRDY
jgi:hypothetical protein